MSASGSSRSRRSLGGKNNSRPGKKDKGKRSSKRTEQPTTALPAISPEDMAYLLQHTKYSEDELNEWHLGFANDCPDGRLTPGRVKDMYDLLMPDVTGSNFVDQLFRIFDGDGSGFIDFKEFMVATSMTMFGTLEDKLKWMFNLYDADNSGSISEVEMAETLYSMQDLIGYQMTQEETRQYASSMFSKLDSDGSGEIDVEEFIAFYVEEHKADDDNKGY